MSRRKSLIKILKKPEKPVRKKDYIDKISIEEYDSLKYYNDYFEDIENVHIEYFYDMYATRPSIYFVKKDLEPDNIYQKRLDEYNKMLEKYNKWYEENKDLIEKELELRKQEKIERDKKLKQKEKVRLQKELKRISKKLEKM
jgi:hypothetical protein